MKCPTCNSTVPVCELCEGCRRQAAQTLESTQAQLGFAEGTIIGALSKLEDANVEIGRLKREIEPMRAMLTDSRRMVDSMRTDIGNLQNRLGQKHVEIEQLKNSIASAVETAQSKDHAKQQSIIYAKESAIRNLQAENARVLGWLAIVKKERDEERGRVRDLETKLKAADQAYAAMKAVAEGNFDTVRKERDKAQAEVRELKQRNENQYQQLRNLTLGNGFEFQPPKPIAIINCDFQKHGCRASMTAYANAIETAATRQGWKVRPILNRDSGGYRFRCYCPPHAMGSEELERLEAIEAANRAEKAAQKNPHF